MCLIGSIKRLEIWPNINHRDGFSAPSGATPCYASLFASTYKSSLRDNLFPLLFFAPQHWLHIRLANAGQFLLPFLELQEIHFAIFIPFGVVFNKSWWLCSTLSSLDSTGGIAFPAQLSISMQRSSLQSWPFSLSQKPHPAGVLLPY